MDQRLQTFYEKSKAETKIEQDLFHRYDVKKGLRNENGTGVCVGLTKIADVVGYTYQNGQKCDAAGKLYYRGIDMKDIVRALPDRPAYGFEEVCFLLLFGYLPSLKELDAFTQILKEHYTLPPDFLEANFLHMPGKNIMNRLQKAVLALYDYDDMADDSGVENTLTQGLSIIAKLPAIICYAYQSKQHRYGKESLIIHPPQPTLSIAENVLYMLRPDHTYTSLDACLLDMLLIVHADHGGGNNSTFTNVVIASTGTDIYSAIAGAIGSLKGPRHGGANRQVNAMMRYAMEKLGCDADEEAIRQLQRSMLAKAAYDKSGLIYGMGHAIYTLSDPRSEVLRGYIEQLAEEKGKLREYAFYQRFERCAKEVMLEVKGIHVCSNVDFYSGFVYQMLQIPEDVYTAIFVLARTVGWLAHNLENKLYDGRIMRPATRYVGELSAYSKREERTK